MIDLKIGRSIANVLYLMAELNSSWDYYKVVVVMKNEVLR